MLSNTKGLGLIVSKQKWGRDSVGNKVVIGYTYHLTKKGRDILDIVL